jgi:hypothetical protein
MCFWLGTGLCLDTHFTVLLRDFLIFVPCWRWLTIIFITLIVDIMVTCYMSVVNFERHELSTFFEELFL